MTTHVFSAYTRNSPGYHINPWVECVPPFILKFFSALLIIAFFKLIHKKFKKLQIVSHDVLYLFYLILRTTSPPILIFIPYILESIYYFIEQTTNIYHYWFLFQEFSKWMVGLGDNNILKMASISPSIFRVC